MKLLNLGCGGQRPQDECWLNMDMLRTFLKPGTPERTNLDAEKNYLDCDILMDGIPFAPGTFDGILCQHVIEHFSCHDAVMVIQDCLKALKEGGVLVTSVPDATYFLMHYDQDARDTAEKIFGEPICKDEPEHERFFDYALFHRNHVQVLTPDSHRCLLIKAGFKRDRLLPMAATPIEDGAMTLMLPYINRRMFSSIVCAYK